MKRFAVAVLALLALVCWTISVFAEEPVSRLEKLREKGSTLTIEKVREESVLPVAEKKGEEKKITEGEISMLVASQYIGSTTGGTFYDGWVAQPCFTGIVNPPKFPFSLYGSLWGSAAFNGGFTSNPGGENDYILGLINDRKFKNGRKLTNDLSYAYYNLQPLYRHGPGDISAVSLKTTYPKIWKLQPYSIVDYYFVRGDSSQNGLAWRVGTAFSPLEFLKDLTFDVSVAGHTKLFGASSEGLSSGKLSLRYAIKLTDKLEISPEVNLQKRFGYNASSEGAGLTQDRFWVGINSTYRAW